MTHLTRRRYVLILAFGTLLTAEAEETDISDSFSCSLTFATDFPDKEPVLLSNSTSGYSLILPTYHAVILKADQKIALSCPGGKNTIRALGDNFATAKCVDNQTLNIDGETYTMSELGCGTTVTGQFEPTTTPCGIRGLIKHIGCKVDDTFFTLFDVCYDNNAGEALYTEHVLHGSAISHSKSLNGRPRFKSEGLGPGVTADIGYRQTTQKNTFALLFNSTELAETYIYPNSYLARGHLSPDGDFVFVSSKCSTFFYINTVPQWQGINNGNWKSLEFAIRKLASNLEEEFKVITGSHEVLRLENTEDEDIEMYLVAENKLPVPKYVWKILYSLETQKAMAFVNLNNPFVIEVTDNDYLCNDMCKDYNWGRDAWLNPARGLVYCCDVKELNTVVATIPALEISGIQEGADSRSYVRKFLNIFG